jgi:glycosyltransferase involved in cell wall biosynthesis
MDKKIKMLVIPSDRTGVGKFRSVAPHVYLAEHYADLFDIDIIYDIPNTNLEEFLKQYDLIHIHKQLDKECQVMDMIKFLDIKVIIDVDDCPDLGEHHPMSLSAKKENWKGPILDHVRKADYVTTTTPIFAKWLSKYNKNVIVLPNAIDPDEKQYQPHKNPRPGGRIRFGLICGSSHLHDIELLSGIARQIPENKLDKMQLVLCGFDTNGTRTIYYYDTGKVERRPIEPHESVWCRYEEILTNNYSIVSPEHKDFLLKYEKNTDDPFENEPYRRFWTRDINQYASHYDNVDVILAPLKECEFNEMKSQLKVIEAGFMDTAIIAQDFGAYTIDLKSVIGKNGVIDETGNAMLVDSAKNHKQWAKYIMKIVDNPELIDIMKSNLAPMVKETYSAEAVAKKRVEAYLKILDIER